MLGLLDVARAIFGYLGDPLRPGVAHLPSVVRWSWRSRGAMAPVVGVLGLAIGGCLDGAAAAASERVALVIGNSAYKHTARLENPINDARDVARVLTSLGFEVIEQHDLDKAGMDRAVRRFADALGSAKTGLFYYAGHGLQVGSQNYLVPIDAELTTASALDFETVRLELVHRTMEHAVTTNIIVLDACRDNPLSRNLARALGTRSASIGRGLAAVESGEGTLISFSTQPGSVALDGVGRNSPYAAALIKHMPKRGDDISSVLINVRNDVMEATGRRQVPWEHSALTARFYFVPPPETETAESAARGSEASGPTYEQQAEMAFWGAVKDSGNRLIIQTYLDRFPQGTFAGLARAMIDDIERKDALRTAALKQAERARAERARKAAEALSEAALRADPSKQSEVLLKAKDEAYKSAEQSLAAAEAAAEDARRVLAKAKSDRDIAASNVTMSDASPTKVAMLPTEASASRAAEASIDPATLAKRLQAGLKRVGCDPGEIDGNWGRKGRAALTAFAKTAKLALPIDEPSEAAVAAVESQPGQVCEITCDDDEELRDGACVSKRKRSRSASKSDDDDEPKRKSSRRSSSTRRTGSSGSSSTSTTGVIGGLLSGSVIGINIGKKSRSSSQTQTQGSPTR